ncbi:phage tail protein [Colwellia psychrerythraea]|jgi:microcystin-dependent protein|uniref:Tail Collar domain protein n=1 Tax=Colwellia psychrerythraea TaxID=28229 RepID=A0A099KYN2_COLPS|nr:tail fiber protein [Colwellia psychrerythraea]KGJ95315.1 Tail Collar domain protein [Colwellia psychrerythraea]
MAEPFLGEIKMFGGNFAPRGYAFCNGALLAISQNQALFSLLGTIYGGDGRTTFALPDLRGRVAMSFGNGAGLTNRPIGQRSGSESNTLIENQMPAHNHVITATAKCKGAAGNANTAVGNVWSNDAGVSSATYSNAGADADMAAGAITAESANTGANQSVNNLQPYLVCNYIIAIQGLFPSRN